MMDLDKGDSVDKKKIFSNLEKDLFLNIIQKHHAILTAKQTNATSALKKKQTWERIKNEFNDSSLVTQDASTKQLTKLWYNMKAKARESKTKENVRFLTGGGPPVNDMDCIDSKVMDVDKNVLTNVAVDIDSDINGTIIISGDTNDESWSKLHDITIEKENEENQIEVMLKKEKPTLIKKENVYGANKIDSLKCEILEEELNFKKLLHEEELKIKTMERKHKEQLFEIELQIKLKELKKE